MRKGLKLDLRESISVNKQLLQWFEIDNCNLFTKELKPFLEVASCDINSNIHLVFLKDIGKGVLAS